MRNAGGYATVMQDGVLQSEQDTFSCKHCNTIVKVPPGMVTMTVGGMCRACMGHICDGCIDEMEKTLRCVPLEARLLQMEMNGRRTRRGGRRP